MFVFGAFLAFCGLASLRPEEKRPSRFSGTALSGTRGPALWDRPPRPSLEEEAAEGHVFSSVSPP